MRSKGLFLAVMCLGFLSSAISQVPILSNSSRISVLTCGSGDDLYTTFGHSAFRVLDPSTGLDVVYNYGTFDFNPPGFYVEFAKGRLFYKLSRQKMDRFLLEYRYENRWVKEQILDLDQEERQALFRFLENNHLPENRTYKYDFLYNNCATKIWDVLKEVKGQKLHLEADYLEKLYTFRELIHQHLETNSWAALGIDLALGSVIDQQASPKEHMFLPIYVMQQLEKAKKDGKLLTFKASTLLQSVPLRKASNFFFTPLFWLLVLLASTLVITIRDFKQNKRSGWWDSFLFGFTGLAGCVLFFLWFLTDHTATAGNLNLLWAFPTNIVIAFFGIKKVFPTWLGHYIKALLGFLVLVIVLGLFKVQVFSPLLLPILLALGLRYFYLILQLRNPSAV